jgi:predicted MFS family arabinose efflux permease
VSRSDRSLPLAILFCGGFVVAADIRVLAPLLPAIADDFGVSVGTAGLTVAVYALAYAGGQFFYGPLGDRVGKVRVIRVVLLLFGIGTALCALAPSFPALIVLRLLTGLFAAGVIPMTLANLGDVVPDYAERRRTIGIFLSALVSGQVFGQVLGGVLAGVFSWNAIFLVLGAIALLIAAGIWSFPASAPRARGVSGRPNFRAMFAADRPLYLLVLAETFVYLGPFSFAAAELVEESGASYALAGGLLTLFAVGSIIASRALHRVIFADDDGTRVALGAGIGALGFVLLATAPGLVLFGLAVFLLGLGMTVAHSTLQTRATEVDPAARGTAAALFAGFANVGSALGTFAGGAMVDGLGYGLLFGTVSVAMLGFAALARLILAGRRPPGDGRRCTPAKGAAAVAPRISSTG